MPNIISVVDDSNLGDNPLTNEKTRFNQFTNLAVRGGTAGGNVTVKNVSSKQTNLLNRAALGTAGQPTRGGHGENLPPLMY